MAHSYSTALKKFNQTLDWGELDDLAAWTIDQAITVQQIPAPTFKEADRAAYVSKILRTFGLEKVDIDELFNVYGLLPGDDPALPGVMVMAHTDTVFPRRTDLTLRHEKEAIYGPGLGDNSIGVAGMLGLLESLQRGGVRLPCNLWCVATSREEGLGDLGGIKAAFERLKPHIKAVINIEGLAFGHIYHSGIAVRRLHITARAEGGHSWLHFGRASAIHGLVELGSRILSIHTSNNPRTTYNIGMIDGGQSINSIASEASLWLDMRSEKLEMLEKLERQVREQVKAVSRDDLSFDVEVVGDRPAGALMPEHPLVKMAQEALEQVGTRGALETGSTDGNVPLSAGCPTVTIGITRGGNAHRLDEYVETKPVTMGLKQLILLTLAACDWQPE